MDYEFNRPELPALGWLTGLRKDDRDILGTYGEFLPAQPNQPIITEGEPQPFLYYIINGSFHIWKTKDGQQNHVATLMAGNSIGEMSIFDLAPASATVAPEDFGQVWRINYEEFMRFVDDNPGAANKIFLALLTTLAKRLRAS